MVVLSGIPAAGKSTLAREMTRREAGSMHVCFDQVLSSLGEFTPECWQTAQSQFYCQVEAAVESAQLVVVDDNFNYLSMVKRYQKLASRCHCMFLHLIVQVDFPTALSRNQARSCPIPEAIIEKMHLQMENQRFLPTSQVLRTGPLEHLVETAMDLVREFRSKEPEIEREEVSLPSASSFTPLHLADLRLRSLISQILTTQPSTARATLGPSLSLLKSQILHTLRVEAVLEDAEKEAEGRLWEQVLRLY